MGDQIINVVTRLTSVLHEMGSKQVSRSYLEEECKHFIQDEGLDLQCVAPFVRDALIVAALTKAHREFHFNY